MRFDSKCRSGRILFCFVVFISSLSAVQAQETTKKKSASEDKKKFAPEDKEVKKAEDEIRGLYKTEFAQKSASDRHALAQKLITVAEGTRPETVEYYALLGLARELSIQLGDITLAFTTIDELAKHYEVNTLIMKANALPRISKVAMPVATAGTHLKEVAGVSLQLAEAAVIADDYETARRLVAVAKDCGVRAKVAAITSVADSRDREIVEASNEFKRLEETLEKWNGKSDDPAVNLAVGRFLCLMKGDWERGLPVLANASDGDLKKLASLETKPPEGLAAKVELGDGWWDLAEKEKGAAHSNLRRRAAHWYAEALPEATGLTATRIQKRLALLPSSTQTRQLDLKQMDTSRGQQAKEGHVRIPPRRTITSKESFDGGVDITVRAKTEKNNIRIHYGISEVIFNWELNNDELRVHRPNRTIGTAKVKALTPNTWYTLRWRVTDKQIDVWVDGKVWFSEKGTFDLSTKAPIRIQATDSALDVKGVDIKPAK